MDGLDTIDAARAPRARPEPGYAAAARTVHRPPPARAAAPSSARVAWAVFAIVVVMFGVSGGLLWVIGYNYDGLAGSAVTKIHPSTYMLVVVFAWTALRSGSPVGYVMRHAQLRPGSVLLLIASLVMLGHIMTQPGGGMGGTIDTYFAPPLMVMLLADVDERGMQRIERAIHVLMTVNAAMGVFELLADHRFFPYRLDGTTFLYDTRSSALQGHPLVNACITSWYVLSMLCGSRSLSAGLKLPLVLLQFAGLVAFGGRVGLVSSLALTAWYVLGQVHRVMRSGRVPILGAAVALIMLAVLPVGLGVMAERGFFTAIAERFIDDGGSANARIEMFAMFDNLPLRDLLVGPDNALIDSNRRVNGLEMGIENPIVKTLLYHGILITLLMTVAMVAFLWDIARRCSRSVWLPTLSFVILVMTSESIAGKTTALSKYAILLLVLYRPARALWVQPAADPATDAAPDAAVDEVRLRRTPRSRTDPRRISLAAASTQEP